MACGKTTLGTALQAAHPEAVEFADLDQLIEHSAGMTVSEIFATHGEPHFRHLEALTLARLCSAPPSGRTLIVGCGGGTPCQPALMDLMLQSGTVIWLLPDSDRTLSRLIAFGASRPLVAGKSPEQLQSFIAQNLTSRLPHYRRAHHIFDSSHLDTPAEIAQSVEQFYNRFIKKNTPKDLTSNTERDIRITPSEA